MADSAWKVQPAGCPLPLRQSAHCLSVPSAESKSLHPHRYSQMPSAIWFFPPGYALLPFYSEFLNPSDLQACCPAIHHKADGRHTAPLIPRHQSACLVPYLLTAYVPGANAPCRQYAPDRFPMHLLLKTELHCHRL